MRVFGKRYVVLPSKMAAGLCRALIAHTGDFCRVRAPGNPAGYFFVAGRFDKVFSKIPKTARFGLGNFCRRVPRAKIRRSRGSPVRVAGRPAGLLIISRLRCKVIRRYFRSVTVIVIFKITMNQFPATDQSYRYVICDLRSKFL